MGPDDEIDQLSEEHLYMQLAGILRARIARGDWKPREKISGEIPLSEEYGLSRPTVRAAVKVLADEGIVRTIPGRGTYVM